MSKSHNLTILVGVSGAGKDTLLDLVVGRGAARKLLGATTREPRDGEEHGVTAYYLSREDFEAKIEAGEFFEWAEYGGNLYGTLLADLDTYDALICIRENVGARDMQKRLGARVVAICVPDCRAAETRMRWRGDSPGAIAGRLAADEGREADARSFSDHDIINGDPQRAADELVGLLGE